ncbi:MAG: calcium/proton exchanger [Candidatus Pacebacteria bacterium]|nr:calcium/proton exchanger [Candidatus Paceibacterota bacterium]
MNKLAPILLIFTPIALLASYFHQSPIAIFVLAALAIVPLAKYIGDATDELTAHTNAGVGGLINATFGNATELIIGIFALNAGLIDVVKASITGSVLGNLLLVLGTAILAGGMKRERQQFNATAAKAAGSMLLLATIALVIPTIFAYTAPGLSGGVIMSLSVLVAILMIVAYVAQLIFSLRTHRHLYVSEKDVAPSWSVRTALIVLACATIAVAFVSDVLVSAITPLVTEFGWTQLFIGVIIVAIVGNVAEHLSAVRAAIKDRMSLTFSIAVGSATQIVMFVAPVLVLISLFFNARMNLVFGLFELIALVLSVYVANAVMEDGESNWLEGIQLLIAYIIMAVAFFFHP